MHAVTLHSAWPFSLVFGLVLWALCQWRLLTLEFTELFVPEEAANVVSMSGEPGVSRFYALGCI